MATQLILSDENCAGQVEAIWQAFERLGYRELLAVKLLTWEEAGLAKRATDETVWRFCQDHQCLLITGNRTGKDGVKALEFVIRQLVTPTSLPVLTIANLNRVLPDQQYCDTCAHQLANIIADIEKYRGVTRLYLTRS
ncbi:MAG: DUF5615 family PIN-like protein [Caldilineaceae bacterium]